MRKLLPLVYTILLFVFPPVTGAEDVKSFDQAKALSSAQGKPLLLEFFRDD
jgi:hypothetical protein